MTFVHTYCTYIHTCTYPCIYSFHSLISSSYFPLPLPLQEGDVTVRCHQTGEEANVTFSPHNKVKDRYKEIHGVLCAMCVCVLCVYVCV